MRLLPPLSLDLCGSCKFRASFSIRGKHSRKEGTTTASRRLPSFPPLVQPASFDPTCLLWSNLPPLVQPASFSPTCLFWSNLPLLVQLASFGPTYLFGPNLPLVQPASFGPTRSGAFFHHGDGVKHAPAPNSACTHTLSQIDLSSHIQTTHALHTSGQIDPSSHIQAIHLRQINPLPHTGNARSTHLSQINPSFTHTGNTRSTHLRQINPLSHTGNARSTHLSQINPSLHIQATHAPKLAACF